MMKRYLATDLIDLSGHEVMLEGWVQTRRDHGKLVFLDLWDRSGLIQLVFNQGEKKFSGLDKVSPQSAIRVTGTVKTRSEKAANDKLPTGKLEVSVEKLEVVSKAHPIPFDIDSNLQIETFLDNAPLTLRGVKSRAVFKVQSAIAWSFTEFFSREGFTEIQTPKIVASATEGGTNLFEIKYFEDKAYLAQSPQLYKQIMTGVFERVFEIAPVFRAEPHSTTRHINEYVSLDIEMAWIKDYTDIIEIGNRFFRHLIEDLRKLQPEFEIHGAQLPLMPDEVPVLTLKQAQEMLKKDKGRNVTGDPDFEPGDEKLFGELIREKYKSDFVWVTHYPTKKRAFYTMPDPINPELSLGVDLIFRGLEIISGGQRINDYDQLVKAIESRGMKPENFNYYLDTFKYGMPPEGGFALGLERLTSKFLGIDNIRLATLFPRDIHRLTP